MSDDIENVFDVTEERIFRTTLTVSKSGFYRVTVHYSHDNWDAWVKLEIVGEHGESMTYIPPLPKKYDETTMLLRLFEGVNRISMAPRYDQPINVISMVVVGEEPLLKPYSFPAQDYFYLCAPRVRRLTVVSYTGAPLKITEGGRQIDFELEDKALYDHADPVETKEPPTYHHLRLHPEALSGLCEGEHVLKIHLPENKYILYTLCVEIAPKEYAFRIVSLDVGHGNCVLMCLPNGKNLLVDTGTERCAGDVIFPYLDEHGISLDYCLISHHHADHVGSLDAILERYPLAKPNKTEARKYIDLHEHEKRYGYLSAFQYLDNDLLCRYDRLERIWDLGGVQVTVLNSRYETNGEETMPGSRDENGISVSLLVSYNGFQYYHGADNYAPNQQRNLDDLASGILEDLRCHYMQANHHFHGDMLPEMIHAIDPVAVVIPADQAIFSRSAYMVDHVQAVQEADYADKRLKDTFVSYTSGTVIALVNNGNDWRYETY